MQNINVGMIFGAVLAFGIIMASTHEPKAIADPYSANARTEQNLAVFTSPTGQQVIVVDKHKLVMSVYQIDPTSGRITLKSVRNIRWDLEFEEYNGANPKPNEIRSLLESQKKN